MKTESEIRELLELFEMDRAAPGDPLEIRIIGCTYVVGILREILGEPCSYSHDFSHLLRCMRARRNAGLRN